MKEPITAAIVKQYKNQASETYLLFLSFLSFPKKLLMQTDAEDVTELVISNKEKPKVWN